MVTKARKRSVTPKTQKHGKASKARKHPKSGKTEKRHKAAKSQPQRKPLLFISHKHENYRIADVLREWIEASTGGTVEVFQSSSDQAAGPRAGFDLRQELKTALWNAGAFVMIYTYPHLDWSYCTFEYGVANKPDSPNTRMILLQCCGSVPPLFEGQTTVNLRDLVAVKKFVKQFLTDPKFFPEYGKAVTNHAANAPAVTKLATQLHNDLNTPGVMPPPISPSDEEWPAYPFLQLQLDMKHVKTIKEAPATERSKIMYELIRKECAVSATDKELARMFGFAPGLGKEVKFDEFIKAWEESDKKRADSQSKWVESLADQIVSAAQWRFPPTVWELMQGAAGSTWYAPILTRVQRVSDQFLQFDIYFFKFEVDDKQKCVKVGIPEN